MALKSVCQHNVVSVFFFFESFLAKGKFFKETKQTAGFGFPGNHVAASRDSCEPCNYSTSFNCIKSLNENVKIAFLLFCQTLKLSKLLYLFTCSLIMGTVC